MASKRRINWDEKADQTLIEMLKSIDDPKWKEISKKMRGCGIEFTPKQCKIRWQNVLNPEIKQEKWSLEEEMTLFDQWICLGNKWSSICESLPGRTENGVKNRFYSTIRRIIRKYKRKFPEKTDFDLPIQKIVSDQDKVRDLLSFSTDGIYHKNRYSDHINASGVFNPIRKTPAEEAREIISISMEKFYESSGVYEIVKLPQISQHEFDNFEQLIFSDTVNNSDCYLSDVLKEMNTNAEFASYLESSDSTLSSELFLWEFPVEDLCRSSN